MKLPRPDCRACLFLNHDCGTHEEMPHQPATTEPESLAPRASDPASPDLSHLVIHPPTTLRDIGIPSDLPGVAAAFLTIFAGNPDAHYVHQKNGECVAVAGGITEADVRRHLCGQEPSLLSVPLLPDGRCRWGAITCDRHGENDPSIDHAALARRVNELNLPLIVCRSKSEKGAHLFLFVKEANGYPAAAVRKLLENYAKRLALDGEIFPKKDEGQKSSGVDVPYFGRECRAFGKDGNGLTSLRAFLALAFERMAYGAVLERNDQTSASLPVLEERGASTPFGKFFPTAEKVPTDMLILKRWIGWRAVWVEEQHKWTKRPVSPLTGQQIGVTPKGSKGQDWKSHWVDFEAARTGALEHGLNGVGFVFVAGDGFVGIDFDQCRDAASGALRASMLPWLESLDTYAEVSPSGTGWHALARGSLPARGNKQPLPEDAFIKVEMYDQDRFFTFTGERIEGKMLALNTIQPEIDALHGHVFGAQGRPLETAQEQEHGALREVMTDDRIIKRITSAKKWASIFDKGSKALDFVAQHYKGDDSSADLAFCNLVSRYTINHDQVTRLWRRSILWREKSAQRDDYRLSTINRAMAITRGTLVDTSVKAEVTWLWENRFPRGKLVVMDGDPGLSKSMFSLAVGASVMTGKPFLDGSKPQATGGVVLLSAEDDLHDTIVPRLVAAGAPDAQEIPMIHVPSTKADGGQFSIADPDDRLELEMMIVRIDAKLVIIDPLNAYLGDKVDSHNDQKIRQVLGPLSEIANRTGVVILCLRHLAKSGGSKAIYRGMGSIGYTAAARANFFVAEHPEEKDTFVFAASKFNLGPKPQSLKYKLAFATVSGISRLVPYVSSGEPCDLTADQLAVSQSQEWEIGKLGEAIKFLEMMLADGPKPASEVERKADKEKIRPRTLRRAQQQLKIEPYQESKKWWWRLPEVVTPELPF